MTREFRCKNTQALFECGLPKRLRAIEAVATCKLAMLDARDFIRSLLGNRLEALKGDRAGQWSVLFPSEALRDGTSPAGPRR